MSYLLQVSESELPVLLDALVGHADRCEQDGDPLGEVDRADDLAGRVRELRLLAVMPAELTLAELGVGCYRLRPQG